MNPLLVPAQDPIDSEWRNELRFNLPDDLYLYLMPPQVELQYMRQQFEQSGHRELPVLRPSEVYRDAFLVQHAALEKLRDQIAMKERNEHVKALYLDRIDEQMANCIIWFAADSMNQGAFEQANEFVYGMPDRSIHAATCTWLRTFALEQTNHPSAAVTAAAMKVLDVVPNLMGDSSILMPSQETYQAVVAVHEEFMERLFAKTEVPDRDITPELGDMIVAQVLRNVGSTYTIADSDDIFWGCLLYTSPSPRDS